MKQILMKTAVLSFVILSVVACGKKNSGGSASGGRDTRITTGPSNLPTGQGTLSGQQGAYVVGNNQTQAQFDELIKALVSTTVQPENVGSVSLNGGVEIRGKVAINPSTGSAMNLQDGSQSRVQLVVTDSKVTSDSVPPILIIVGGATGSAVNYNANLSFSDEYGTITITGSYNQTTFTGTVSFANKTGGYNGRTSGTLGTFSIPTCAFFVCQ